MPIEYVILLGFMGSGKSTVGRLVAAALGWPFCDLDQAIVEAECVSVAEIFATRGEPAFRRVEGRALARMISARCTVLALGGGSLEDPGNAALVQSMPRALRIYLHTHLEVAVERCTSDSAVAERPVLREAEARYARREPQYRQLADLVLDSNGCRPAELADTIVQAVLQP